MGPSQLFETLPDLELRQEGKFGARVHVVAVGGVFLLRPHVVGDRHGVVPATRRNRRDRTRPITGPSNARRDCFRRQQAVASRDFGATAVDSDGMVLHVVLAFSVTLRVGSRRYTCNVLRSTKGCHAFVPTTRKHADSRRSCQGCFSACVVGQQVREKGREVDLLRKPLLRHSCQERFSACFVRQDSMVRVQGREGRNCCTKTLCLGCSPERVLAAVDVGDPVVRPPVLER